MSIYFAGASTDRVDISAAASIDDLATRTHAAWIYMDGAAVAQDIISYKRQGSDGIGRFHINTTDLRVVIGQSGTLCNYISNNASIATTTWYFVAYTYTDSGANRVHLYLGSRTVSVVELTYGTAADGTGTVTADNTGVLRLGGGAGNTNTRNLNGKIAWFGLWNRVLSLAELQDQQFHPHVTSGCKVFQILGYNGLSTQPDWSGNSNNGTVNGSAIGATHVPLGSPFAYRGIERGVSPSSIGPLIHGGKLTHGILIRGGRLAS